MNYPEHRYTVEQKSRAVALVRSGMSATRAAAELRIPERSVQIWSKRFRETAAKGDPLLNAESYRIAERSGELIHQALDFMEEQGPEAAYKSLAVLNALRGTSVDKIIASQKTEDPTTRLQFVIVRSSDQRDVLIEGEARMIELPED